MKYQRPKLEFEDIQGLVVRGFGKLPYSGYTLFSIKDEVKFKRWLAAELTNGLITPATVRGLTIGSSQAIAYTASGLQKLMGDEWIVDSFPLEFIEGMVQEHRSRLLGDYGPNSPHHWEWGNGDNIDGVLISSAEEEEAVTKVLDSALVESNGLSEVTRINARVPADGKEPFGFSDGVSQPIIMGTDREKELRSKHPREHKLNAVAAGEFILGYPDGTGKLPRSPAFSPAADTGDRLQSHHERHELRDFGRNGSFVVIRQLAQDTKAFNQYIESNAREGIDLGAKMVGRTKEGKTLATDPKATECRDNDFDYLYDLKGKGCPIGSHVRRMNPRSTVQNKSQDGSLMVTNRHRVIRRGRVYQNHEGEVGLLFLCLNASINRQFEFIQSTWSNDPFFQGLAGEVDPIIGTRREETQYYTIPGEPYRQKLKAIPQWVTVKGGAYFFMPSLRSLETLAAY